MLDITQLDHVSVLITNVERSRAFYRDLLGLKEVPRPRTFDFVALWFELGNHQLHLLLKEKPDSISPRHFALRVADINAARRYFAGKSVPMQETTLIPGADRFFIFDPDGNRIEIIHGANLTVRTPGTRPAWRGDVRAAFPPATLGEEVMNRAEALALLNEHVKKQALVRHMLAVEVAMKAYARKLSQDEEKWGIVGLLHDFDYERWPDPPAHPLKGSEILRRLGYPEDVIYAILSHADYLQDYPRVHPLDKALYACDELAGLITATARLRPNGITDLPASSVQKKMKQKDFARNVNRDDIERGAADFGVALAEHIQFEIDAMKTIAAELGLERGSGTGE